MPDMEIIRQLIEDVGRDAALKLMALFKSDVEKRILAIRDYQANGGDIQTLRIQAHSLKGLCRTYGAASAGEVAMELQQACDAGDAAAIVRKTQDILDLIPGEVDAVIEAVRTQAQN
jgi:HPt (histidine-containing phosphotransfer) domain-containing protein